MSNRSLIFIVLIAFLSCKEKKVVKKDKTNLLIILSDQHSYDMLGAYGNTQILTPNLDKFASEGIRFDNAFSNQPVCTPYRGMLLSGMHPLKNGAFINDTPLLPNNSKLLPQILKEQGYQTAYIGKWHLLGGDRDRPIPKGKLRYGFDEVFTNNCHVDFRPGKAFFWNEQGEKEYFDEWEVYGQTNQALNYLDTIDKEKPFALIVSWHPPHDWGLFKGEDGQMHFRYDTLDELMALYNRDSIKVRPGLEPTPDRKRMYHGHMAMITGVDKAFGQLMNKLKEIGAEDNTLTIFSADHGDMLESNQTKKPKQYLYDYSSKIPFVVKFPKKIKDSSSTKLLFSTLDIMPTTLGLLDIKSNQNYDGKDLSKDILNGNEDVVASIPMWIYSRYMEENTAWRGVVTKDYAFSMSKPSDSTSTDNLLFYRKNDPFQLNNLFDKPEYSDEKERLKILTYQWMEKYEDEFYDLSSFKNIMSIEEWSYNYKIPPIGVLSKLHNK